jgi:hypothetical protein
MQWRYGVGAVLLACAFAAGAYADVPLSSGSVQATVGGTVTITAGLVDPGAYTLTLTDPNPDHGTICAAKLAGPAKAIKGKIKLTGRVPTSIACYSSDGSLLTHVKMAAGTYTVFLCQADGPTGCDGSHTVIEHHVVVHLPAGPHPHGH